MSEIKIKWIPGYVNAAVEIADVGNYRLRVQRIKQYTYKWELYFNNHLVISQACGVHGKTLSEAKKLAEVAFWTHRLTN